MLELQNNYVVYLAVKFDMGKVKIDYATYPVEKTEVGWSSKVSNETFDEAKFKESRLGFVRLEKTKGNYYCWHIMSTDKKDFLEVERELLPKAANFLCKKMPFDFKYKEKLRERVKRILS